VSGRGNGHGDEPDVERSPSATAMEEPSGLAPSPQPDAAEGALDPDGTPAAPAAARDELDALRRECSELRETLLRRRADFENFRKRVERDRGAVVADAEAAVLRQVLGTVDNLERALAAQDSGAALREGVVLTHRELVALLESLGVEALDPRGERFDPAVHQAILHEPAEGFADGCVAEVYRKGFRYRDRLLRPALVKVASAAAAPDGDEGADI
jgi:molecular chaperone GrpE